MVKVQVGKNNYYLDGIHKSNLDIMKAEIVNDWDFITVYDGGEGTGKSTKCVQDHLYLDPTLNIDRTCFSGESFEKSVLHAKKYQAVIYDEAITGLYSREAMGYINTQLTKLLAQIRQKNLFIGIVIPSYFDLDRYVAMWRSRALIHVYTNRLKRGFFKFYSYTKKNDLYVRGKKYYNYGAVKPDFFGRFTKFHPFEEEYRKKKAEALENVQIKQTNPYKQRDILIMHMYNKLGIQQKEIAKLLGFNASMVSHIVTSNNV